MKSERQTVWVTIMLLLIAVASAHGQPNTTIRVGGGYFGEYLTRPGGAAHVEIERTYRPGSATRTSASVAAFRAQDYVGVYASVHTGFRVYLGSRFFIDQSVGLGALANIFTVDSIWFTDRFGTAFRYGGPNYGVVPSVSLGIGVALGSDAAHLLWVRPTVYWNLGMRGINLPYEAVEFGYSVRVGGKQK